MRALITALFAALMVAPAALGQASMGNLHGTVTDQNGQRMAGVVVKISGIAQATEVTDRSGTFQFRRLDPGAYLVSARREGYSPVDFPDVYVQVSRTTTIEAQMTPAVEQQITIKMRK